MLKWFFNLSPHVRIAVIMLPFMAIGGYGLMDLWIRHTEPEKVREQQNVAMQQLLVEGQCLLAANQCNLSADSIKVSLKLGEPSQPGVVRVEARANEIIRGVKFVLVRNGEEQNVIIDRPPEQDVWFGEFPESLLEPPPSTVRIAVVQTGRIFYAETPAKF